jgi:hypothetical protein
MQFEFDLNQQLRQQEQDSNMKIATLKEGAKDKRETAKKFESSGNDILGGGMGLDKFNPQIGT